MHVIIEFKAVNGLGFGAGANRFHLFYELINDFVENSGQRVISFAVVGRETGSYDRNILE